MFIKTIFAIKKKFCKKFFYKHPPNAFLIKVEIYVTNTLKKCIYIIIKVIQCINYQRHF